MERWSSYMYNYGSSLIDQAGYVHFTIVLFEWVKYFMWKAAMTVYVCLYNVSTMPSVLCLWYMCSKSFSITLMFVKLSNFHS